MEKQVNCYNCGEEPTYITFTPNGLLCGNCRAKSLDNINPATITIEALLARSGVTKTFSQGRRYILSRGISINGIKVEHLGQEVVKSGTYEISIGKYRVITVEFVDEQPTIMKGPISYDDPRES